MQRDGAKSQVQACGFLAPRVQGVHVAIWFILRAQRGSHIPTLRAKYIPYTYMDPLDRV